MLCPSICLACLCVCVSVCVCFCAGHNPRAAATMRDRFSYKQTGRTCRRAHRPLLDLFGYGRKDREPVLAQRFNGTFHVKLKKQEVT